MAPHPANAVRPEDLEGDLVSREDPRFGVVWINPERLSGEPCFFGTRVPVKALFDYLEAGDDIGSFIADFPGVTREQAVAVLEMARQRLASGDRAA